MNNKQVYGMEGEQLAYKKLKKLGYKILERNYRCPLGEVDLIAMHKGDLVFIEVKSRNSLLFGRPCEAVDWTKQQKLQRLAEYYINYKRAYNLNARFDVVEVLGDEIDIIEDAWELESESF